MSCTVFFIPQKTCISRPYCTTNSKFSAIYMWRQCDIRIDEDSNADSGVIFKLLQNPLIIKTFCTKISKYFFAYLTIYWYYIMKNIIMIFFLNWTDIKIEIRHNEKRIPIVEFVTFIKVCRTYWSHILIFLMPRMDPNEHHQHHNIRFFKNICKDIVRFNSEWALWFWVSRFVLILKKKRLKGI